MEEYLDRYKLINEAIEMAAKAHKNQFRKAGNIPYIVHPFEVALILQENNADKEVIIAGILHDTLEDTEIKEDDIRSKFGDKILELVICASEELEDRDTRPWKDRKKHTIKFIRSATLKSKLITCADKLSNLRSMIRGYNNEGKEHWRNFNGTYPEQKWYYENLLQSLEELEGYKMYEEFKEGIKYLFGSKGESFE